MQPPPRRTAPLRQGRASPWQFRQPGSRARPPSDPVVRSRRGGRTSPVAAHTVSLLSILPCAVNGMMPSETHASGITARRWRSWPFMAPGSRAWASRRSGQLAQAPVGLAQSGPAAEQAAAGLARLPVLHRLRLDAPHRHHSHAVSAAAGTGRAHRGARLRCRCGSAGVGVCATARRRSGGVRRPGAAVVAYAAPASSAPATSVSGASSRSAPRAAHRTRRPAPGCSPAPGLRRPRPSGLWAAWSCDSSGCAPARHGRGAGCWVWVGVGAAGVGCGRGPWTTARSRAPSWSLAAILAAASNTRRVCSTVATSVACSWSRPAFRSARSGRRRDGGAAGTATVCSRARELRRSARRTAWTRAVSAAAARRARSYSGGLPGGRSRRWPPARSVRPGRAGAVGRAGRRRGGGGLRRAGAGA